MINELDMCEEEAAACVFFMLAWRYVGVGPEKREKAIRLLSDDGMEKVPLHIRESMSKRLHRSVCGGGYEWIDRAAPGYSVTIDAMYERAFDGESGDLEPPEKVRVVDAFRDQVRRSSPGQNAAGMSSEWLCAIGQGFKEADRMQQGQI